jgi:hypothetical protein
MSGKICCSVNSLSLAKKTTKKIYEDWDILSLAVFKDGLSPLVFFLPRCPTILLHPTPGKMFELCHVLRRRGMLSFFIDVTTGHKDQENLCRKMADLSGGVYVPATIG